MKITGKTRVVVHLAYPAKHLRTPEFFNPLVARLGHDAVLIPWEVSPSALPDAWAGLRKVENLAGVIVTVPHKQAVAQLCDELEGTAAALGVANVARRLPDGRFAGRMFDGDGFVRGLLNAGHPVEGKRVLLLGAGGAATGIAHGLLAAGAADLAIYNRSNDKAEALVTALVRLYPGRRIRTGPADGAGFDIIVNGTALGLRTEDPLPLDPSSLGPGSVVAEVVMNPDVTPLLLAAQMRGLTIHRGVHMITGQVQLLADFLLSPFQPSEVGAQ
ncbi:shikimate dehydrogenase [Ensifer sp. YR511]|uniref:shikimate dehydrogenase family protein n=1 Tax=Ensifer sp. YR511 TaxID=1855294 RepID=UPI00087E9714|nr:shikimate dehydrogenase [Ensifer sp. YR511]SDN03696.1 shikimate dehydrogenase [Ensifer sp. YR511]